MPYIGRGIETLSDRVVLDSLTASATASYTLQLNSVNFVPSSASSLTVSLNGVIQKPDSSYTVSGSTLTFASTLSASDSIDFVIAERGITLQTPSAGSVGTSQLASSAVTNAKIASDAAIATTKLGTGAVLQVVQAVKTDRQDTTSTSYADVTGLSVSITPSSTSNKVLVILDINNISNTIASVVRFKVLRDSTVVTKNTDGGGADTQNAFATGGGGGTAANDRKISSCNLHFIDSPSSTSSLTYKVQMNASSASTTSSINNWQTNNDMGSVSAITLMEIAG